MARSRKPQGDLPGMEDRRIEPLHSKAIEYDAVKLQRMKLTEQEVALKKELIALMEQHGKTTAGYSMEGVAVEYVPGKPADPTIKVRIAPTNQESDPTEPGQVIEGDFGGIDDDEKDFS